jgi:hypothetical protein
MAGEPEWGVDFIQECAAWLNSCGKPRFGLYGSFVIPTEAFMGLQAHLR